MRLLGSLVYEEKEYTLNDVRVFIDRKDFGLPDGFYGGRVDRVAKTDTEGVYLCMDGMDVIDILIDDIPFSDEVCEKDYQEYTNDELKSMLLEIGIDAPKKATKVELIALLGEGVE